MECIAKWVMSTKGQELGKYKIQSAHIQRYDGEITVTGNQTKLGCHTSTTSRISSFKKTFEYFNIGL